MIKFSTKKKERIALIRALDETIKEYPDISIETVNSAISIICNIPIHEAREEGKIALKKITKFPEQFQVKGSKENQ